MHRLTITGLLAIAVCATSSAQTDKRDEALEALQACRQISVADVRLACMDAASTILDGIDQTETTAPIAPAPPTPSITKEAQALEQERAALAAEREALAQQRADLDRAAEQQAATALATAETERLAAERAAIAKERAELEAARAEAETTEKKRFSLLSAPKGLGFFDNDDRPKRFHTTVTKIIVNNAGRHYFTTEDGTVWKQVPATALTAPSSLPAEVSIRRSASGSRRLAFDEHPNRSYVVTETKTE